MAGGRIHHLGFYDVPSYKENHFWWDFPAMFDDIEGWGGPSQLPAIPSAKKIVAPHPIPTDGPRFL
jgi:hypothetical protein